MAGLALSCVKVLTKLRNLRGLQCHKWWRSTAAAAAATHARLEHRPHPQMIWSARVHTQDVCDCMRTHARCHQQEAAGRMYPGVGGTHMRRELAGPRCTGRQAARLATHGIVMRTCAARTRRAEQGGGLPEARQKIPGTCSSTTVGACQRWKSGTRVGLSWLQRAGKAGRCCSQKHSLVTSYCDPAEACKTTSLPPTPTPAVQHLPHRVTSITARLPPDCL